MTIPAPDPAAERTPVARGAAPGVSLGGPSPSTVREGEGGTSSPPPAERSMDAGTPDPETGAVPLSPLGAAPPVRGRAGRTFTIALPAGLKLLSLHGREHWAERARRTEALKKAAWAMALQAKIPRLERVAVTVEYQPRDLRHYDAENTCAPSGKACLDGIVAAGVLEDDECPRYVTGIWCTIGQPYPKGRLVLHLTEIAATGGTDGAA